MEEKQPASRKGHFWLGLSVGLLLGIVLAISFYFLDKYTALEMLRFQRANTESATTDTIVKVVKTPVEAKKPAFKKDTTSKNTATMPSDSIITEETEDFEEYSTDDLMLEMDEEPATIAKTTGIASRRIRVINGNAMKIEPDIEFFDVEQWSEPVKNRLSYQRTGSTLKIKGIDIDNIEIYWMETEYSIFYNNHWYPIPENTEFTRLSYQQ